MNKSKGKRIVALVLLAVIGVVLARAFWPLPNTPLIISKQTTYFTSPLNADGTVDYVAAFNEHFGSHVRPEDNMAAVLMKAVGPDGISDPAKKAGIPSQLKVEFAPDWQYLVERGDYTAPLSIVLEAGAPPKIPLSPEDEKRCADILDGLSRYTPPDRTTKQEFEDILRRLASYASAGVTLSDDFIYDEFESTRHGPWRAEEHPLMADYVATNKQVIDRFIASPLLPHLFVPRVSTCAPAEWDEGYTIGGRLGRELAFNLKLRAMLDVGEGDFEEAWRIGMMLCHLGRLFARTEAGECPSHATVFQSMGTEVIGAVAREGNPTSEQALAMLREYRALPQDVGSLAGIALDYRIATLDLVMQIYRAPATMPVSGQQTTKQATLIFNFNNVLRRINAVYDELDAVAQEPDYVKRREKAIAISAAHDQLVENLKANIKLDPGTGQMQLFLSGPQTKQAYANDALLLIALGTTLPSATLVVDQDIGCAMRSELAAITLALAAYRADEGEYPAELSALAPKYLPEIPRDFFTGEPLHYVREGESYRLWSVGSDEEDDGGYDIYDVGLDLPSKH